MHLASFKECTGCHACYSVCPKSAISMIPNSEGFLYPEIDSSKCIQCNLCSSVCPVINLQNKSDENTIAYALAIKDKTIRMESSSGGAFTSFAEQIITENGIVFGAKFDSNFQVIHGWTNNVEGLADFRGSKYLQSNIHNSYIECKDSLNNGQKVLFTGTPCQIQGLKRFLKKEYDNLITVDFVCHGVPSPLLWKTYLEYRVNTDGHSFSDISKISFRNKDDGWKKFSLSVTYNDSTKYRQLLSNDYYMKLFLRDVALRKSCYNCSAKGVNRISDITIADFWGLQNILPEIDDDTGTSLIIVHSDKGKSLISKLTDCTITEVNLNDCIKFNSAIINSKPFNRKRNRFYKDLNNKSFLKVVNKYSEKTAFEKICSLFVRALKKAKKIIFMEHK